MFLQKPDRKFDDTKVWIQYYVDLQITLIKITLTEDMTGNGTGMWLSN